MVGNGMGAKNGILFKTAVSLEETGKMQIVALDKTGTITSGEPQVTDIIPAEGVDGTGAAGAWPIALEKKSEHPLARAVLRAGRRSRGIARRQEVTDFQALPGNGLTGSFGTADAHAAAICTLYQQGVHDVSDEMQAAGRSSWPKTARRRCFSAVTASCSASLPWRTSSRKTARRRYRSCRTWASMWSCSPATTSAPPKPSARRPAWIEVIAGVLPEGKESVIRSAEGARAR